MKQINYLLLVGGLTCLSFSGATVYAINKENKYPYQSTPKYGDRLERSFVVLCNLINAG